MRKKKKKTVEEAEWLNVKFGSSEMSSPRSWFEGERRWEKKRKHIEVKK